MWELQRAAYAVEAALLGDDRIPPLHESLQALRSSPLSWLGAFEGDALVGAAAVAETTGELDVHRLVVAPSHHRRGIGRLLVSEVLRRAGDRPVLVATGRDNVPARRLYERTGFVPDGEDEVLPGLWVSRYVHRPSRQGR